MDVIAITAAAAASLSTLKWFSFPLFFALFIIFRWAFIPVPVDFFCSVDLFS